MFHWETSSPTNQFVGLVVVCTLRPQREFFNYGVEYFIQLGIALVVDCRTDGCMHNHLFVYFILIL